MPRDPNLIQNPELIRRLATSVGMRTAHITPSLSPTVQAVIVADDLTQQSRRSTEGQLTGASRVIGVTQTGLSTIAGNEHAIVFYNYPPSVVAGAQSLNERVALRYLELRTKGAALPRVVVGWRDAQSAATSATGNSGLDSILDPQHGTAEFLSTNQGGIGMFILSPGVGVGVAGFPFYDNTNGVAAGSALVWRGTDYPVVIRRGTGLVVQGFGAPAVVPFEVTAVFDVEAYV